MKYWNIWDVVRTLAHHNSGRKSRPGPGCIGRVLLQIQLRLPLGQLNCVHKDAIDSAVSTGLFAFTSIIIC